MDGLRESEELASSDESKLPFKVRAHTVEIMTDISGSLGWHLRAVHASRGSLRDAEDPDVWLPPASANFQLQEPFRLKRFDHHAQQLYSEKKPRGSLWQDSILPAAAFPMSLLIFLFCAFLTALLGGFETLGLNEVYSFPRTSLGACVVRVVRTYVPIYVPCLLPWLSLQALAAAAQAWWSPQLRKRKSP